MWLVIFGSELNVQPYETLQFDDYFNIHIRQQSYKLVGKCYLIMFDIYELTTCYTVTGRQVQLLDEMVDTDGTTSCVLTLPKNIRDG